MATVHSAKLSTAMAEPSRHTIGTRLLHAGLAIAIIVQLGSSQFMNPDDGGNSAFSVHQYSGLAAFALVLGFWVATVLRKRGTALHDLFPWTNATRRAAVWADIMTHIAALKARSLPTHDDHSALASAIHGLGLLLMTAMAASGTLYYFVNAGDPDAGGLVGLAMFVHTTLANLVWAYLIGHAGLAVLNHFAGTLSLRTMWSLKGSDK
jgi:cytochrome b561